MKTLAKPKTRDRELLAGRVKSRLDGFSENVSAKQLRETERPPLGVQRYQGGDVTQMGLRPIGGLLGLVYWLRGRGLLACLGLEPSAGGIKLRPQRLASGDLGGQRLRIDRLGADGQYLIAIR